MPTPHNGGWGCADPPWVQGLPVPHAQSKAKPDAWQASQRDSRLGLIVKLKERPKLPREHRRHGHRSGAFARARARGGGQETSLLRDLKQASESATKSRSSTRWAGGFFVIKTCLQDHLSHLPEARNILRFAIRPMAGNVPSALPGRPSVQVVSKMSPNAFGAVRCSSGT